MKAQLAALAATVLFSSSASAADWTAASSTAIYITGDVRLDGRTITLDGRHRFRTRQVRALTSAELAEMKDLFLGKGFSRASLYEVHVPASTKLVNGNTLCGPLPTTRMIVASEADELYLVFLSGSKEPFPPGWKGTVNSGLCGSYRFTR